MKFNLNLSSGIESEIVLDVLINLQLSELKVMIADCAKKMDEIGSVLKRLKEITK